MGAKILKPGYFDLARAIQFLRNDPLLFSHPDWLTQEERLAGPSVFVLEDANEISAILCTANEDPDAAWIRFFACQRDGQHQVSFQTLSTESIRELREKGVKTLFCTGAATWFTRLLEERQFSLETQVVTLATTIVSQSAQNFTFDTQQMQPTDLAKVCQLDHQAFSPEWRLNQSSLEHAFANAAIARIGLIGDEIVAYSLTNTVFGIAHLNRLAVLPQMWGSGLGKQMLVDLNLQCAERGITDLTVNTQEDNLRSIALYQRFGFALSGEKLPIYRLELTEIAD